MVTSHIPRRVSNRALRSLRSAATLQVLERRVLLDGSIFDDDFGTGGLFSNTLGFDVSGFGPDTATVTSFEPVSAVSDAAGNTYVLGDVGIRARLSNTIVDYFDAGVLKLLPNGQRDTTYGNDSTGIAMILDPLLLDPFLTLPNRDAGALVLDDLGRVVYTGTAFDLSPSGEGDVIVGRFTDSGDPDPTFFASGGGGGTVVDIGANSGLFFNSEDDANAIAIDPFDGTIVVGGGTQAFGGAQMDVFLLKLNAAGELVTTFGTFGTGIESTSFPGSDDVINALAIDPFDGRIIAAGSTETSDTLAQFAVVAYSFSGVLDTDFGGFNSAAGTMVFSFASPGDSLDEAYTVDIDPLTGEIYVGGYTASFDLNTLDFRSELAIAKLNTDGSFDLDWGPGSEVGDGGATIITLPDVPIAGVNKLAVQPDGGLLLAGDFATGFNNTSFDFTQTGVFIGLLTPDGFLDTTFDDDGVALLDNDLQPFSGISGISAPVSAEPKGRDAAGPGMLAALELAGATGNSFSDQLDAKANGIPVEYVEQNGGFLRFGIVAGNGSTVTTGRIDPNAIGQNPFVSLPTAITTVTSGSFVQFVLRFQDDLNILVSSIAAGDIQIVQPGGSIAPVTVTAVNPNTNAKSVDVTVQFTKGSNFTEADNGQYSVQVVAGSVSDTEQLSVAGGVVGTFTITIPPTPADVVAPTATANIPATATVGAASQQFTVTFSDNESVAVASIGTGDVQVTGPNGFSQPATLVSLDANTNGTPRTATYTVVAPGGTWDFADNGTYMVTLLAATVSDVTGNVAGQATLGTFVVDAPQGPGNDLRGEIASAFKLASVVGGAKGADVSVRVVNSGDLLIRSTVNLRVIMSGDDVVDGSDFTLGTIVAKLNLKAGANRIFKGKFNFPSPTSAANLRVLAVIDADGALAEKNESNNTAVGTQTVAVAPPFTDLRGTIGKLASKFRLGKKATIPLSLFNDGNVAAKGTVNVRLIASTDDVLDQNDRTLGEVPVKLSVNPGRSGTGRASVTIPADLAAGAYRIIAVVNTGGLLGETDLSDNTLFSTVAVNFAIK